MSINLAAIDFGTTYSGYAFSVSPLKTKLPEVQILSNQSWNAGIREAISLKTPTCLLLTKDKEIVAFGYEAENQYTDIVLDGQQDDYYFFYRFKMNLHNNKDIAMGMVLEDVRGKALPAIDVFSLSIKALMKHMKGVIEIKNVMLDENTRWVLTVPAIWTDTAKLFMRKVAGMAGIPEDKLTLALEPEAASVFCQTFPSAGSIDIVNIGSKYIVVDLGGGTVDITAHEKLPDGSLKELCKASGNDCGGTSIDRQFIQVFVDIFGQSLLDKMKMDFPEDYLGLVRSFENVKRTLKPDKTGLVNITIPNTILDKLCQSELNDNIQNIVASSAFGDYCKLYHDKFRMDASYAKSLFALTTENIVSLINSVMYESDAAEVGHILLVGGFAECKLVQEAVKVGFPDKQVTVPDEAGLAVLKGAVLFGYKPDSISSRVTRYTYGVEVVRLFDDIKDSLRRKVYVDGNVLCDNVFQPFMKANTSVHIGKELKHTYGTSEEFQQSHFLPIYYTEKDNVEFIDEGGCMKLGEVEVEIPNPTKHSRDVDVIFHFGETEISITAIDKESGRECKTAFEIEDFN